MLCVSLDNYHLDFPDDHHHHNHDFPNLLHTNYDLLHTIYYNYNNLHLSELPIPDYPIANIMPVHNDFRYHIYQHCLRGRNDK
jgi:hypothetical protein